MKFYETGSFDEDLCLEEKESRSQSSAERNSFNYLIMLIEEQF